MNTPSLIASGITVLIVFGLVAYRLLWLASQAASGSGLGRLKLPKRWKNFLFGERNDTSAR